MKVLILTASVGSGHVRAAQAVERALRLSRPDAEVEILDVLGLANRPFRTLYGDGYIGLAGKAPSLIGYLYDATDKPTCLPFTEMVRTAAQRISLPGFARAVVTRRPDVVLHTHFLPVELMAKLRLGIPHAVAVTDFHAHRLWAQPGVDRYFVAAPETTASLQRWGVASESISATGIPVDPLFDRRASPAAETTILQLAGGSGVGPIEQVFAGLCAIKKPLRLIVVAGRNAAARRRLVCMNKPLRHRYTILGFTDRVHEFMAQASLVVSKPGGLSVSEALALGVPFAAVSPIPGQESRNAAFLVEKGAGILIGSPSETGARVAQLWESPRRLPGMRARALAVGKPRAAYDVAEALLALAAASSIPA